MSGRKTSFELVNGRIILKYEQLVWGEWLEVFKEDVTDKVMPVVDDHLDEKLGLTKLDIKPKPKQKTDKIETAKKPTPKKRTPKKES